MRRLKKRSQFQAVLAGKKIAATAHFVLHRCTLDSGDVKFGSMTPLPASKTLLFAQVDVWLGAMVSKRWARHAVTRNTIKRQIYSVSFEFEPVLPLAAHIVRLRASFDRTRFFSASSATLKLAVRKELSQLFFAATQADAGRQSTRQV